MKTNLTILIAALLLAATATRAQDFAGGAGTEASPWQIATAAQLSSLRNYLGIAHSGKYFRLSADIDLSTFIDETWQTAGWLPVGTGVSAFSGHLDGAGHQITGLRISRTTTDYVGLFGSVSGTVTRLGVVTAADVGVRGRSYVGALAGSATGRITNCFVNGVARGATHVGALAGRIGATVSDCYATGSVTGNANTGGLAGSLTSAAKVSNCYAAVTVNASGSSAGSLAGSSATGATVANCYYLKTDGAPSGIGGAADGSNVAGKSVAQMKTQSSFAGFDFASVWTISEGQTFPYLRGVGNDRPGSSVTGGEDPDPDPDEGEASTDFAGGKGTAASPYLITTPQQLSNLRNWLGETHKDKYFKLGNDINILSYCTETWGTAGWEPVGTYSNSNNDNVFFGHLDGGGYKVTGLWINRGTYYFIGLFGATGSGSTIDKLDVAIDNGKGGVKGSYYVGGLAGQSSGSIADCHVTGNVTGSGGYIGGLVGSSDGSIADSYATGNVTAGNSYVGGLVGSSDGSITNSHATGNVTASGSSSSVGGLVGVSSGSITNSHATGNVTTSGRYSSAGGLVGVSSGSITNSHATGNVTASGSDSYAGGLVSSSSGSITNSYATGDVGGSYAGGLVSSSRGSITNCYATGDVKGSYAGGGLAGQNNGNISNSYAAGAVTGSGNNSVIGSFVGTGGNNILNCYYLKATGRPNGIGGSSTSDGNIVGLTAAQMKSQSSFPGFNFSTVWTIDEGKTYPYLHGVGNDRPGSGGSSTIAVTGVSLNASSKTLTVNETFQLTATVAPPDATNKTVSWTSSREAVATVSSSGLVKAVSAGTARITVTTQDGNKTATCDITVSATSQQDFAGGSGTESNPYLISTPQQLNNLRKYLGETHGNKYFKLANDIDVSSFSTATWGDSGWEPVSTFTASFSGHLDGAGHKVIGLWINRSSVDYVGLFGLTSGGSTIDRLGVVIDNGKGGVKGRTLVGGLVGQNNSSITDSYTTGDVTGRSRVGGLAGDNAGGSITNCYTTGNITGGGNNVGGLAAYNNGNISTSYATGDVTGSSTVGGLVAYNNGNISASYATGDITGESRIGGLVSYCYSGTITNCYATGNVTGSAGTVGGLIGHNDSYSSITNCYATGAVTGTYDVGSFVGSNDSNISNCYYLKATGRPTGNGNSVDNGNLVGLTATQMKSQSSFTGFNFSTVWNIDEGKTYPYLRGVGNDRPGSSTGGEDPDNPSTDFAGGSGTSASPYLIATAQQLSNLRKYLGETHKNKYFKLSSDISLSTYIAQTWSADGWEPVGAVSYDQDNQPTSYAFFYGHLDGAGHKVTGLWINRSSVEYVGLFGITGAGSTIERLGVETDNSKGGVRGGSHTGGLVGKSAGSITDCYTTGNVTGTASGYAGGLAGLAGSITGSHATGQVTGLGYVGGLAGQATGIARSYATCSVSGTGHVGGLAGNVTGNVTAGYATGSVTGSGTGISNVGGLAGGCGGSITNCYATGDVTGSGSYGAIGGLAGNSGGSITNSYAVGTVSGSSLHYYVGSLVGAGSSISNCYYRRVTGGPGGAGSSVSGSITGLSVDELRSKNSFTGFDFNTVWNISEGKTYPYLRGVGNDRPGSSGAGSASQPLPSGAALHAYSSGNLLHIGGLTAGARFAIYNIRGQLLLSGTAEGSEQTVSIPAADVLVVVSGGQSVKVITVK